jgi:hypothetical protein
VLVSGDRLEPGVVDRGAHREVVDDLEGIAGERERSMAEVVEEQPMPVARMPDASASRYRRSSGSGAMRPGKKAGVARLIAGGHQIQAQQWRADETTKGIGLGRPIHVAQRARVSARVVLGALVVRERGVQGLGGAPHGTPQ